MGTVTFGSNEAGDDLSTCKSIRLVMGDRVQPRSRNLQCSRNVQIFLTTILILFLINRLSIETIPHFFWGKTLVYRLLSRDLPEGNLSGIALEA